MTKDTPPAELIAAIRMLLAGKRYVSRAFADHLVMNLDNDGKTALHEALSNRELEVLRLIAAGKPLTAIARELF